MLFLWKRKSQPLYDTLAAALGGILLNAEKKQINVQVDCPENLVVSHDRKWTGEALFNILDNAVKYTPEGGQIRVSVESWEMYVKKSTLQIQALAFQNSIREQFSSVSIERTSYML